MCKELPHATCELIGLGIAPKNDTDECKQALADFTAEVDDYLAKFTPGPNCPRCGAQLGGLLGSFDWGIANGEGFYGQCNYPARGIHYGPFEAMSMILPYHPSMLAKNHEQGKT